MKILRKKLPIKQQVTFKEDTNESMIQEKDQQRSHSPPKKENSSKLLKSMTKFLNQTIRSPTTRIDLNNDEREIKKGMETMKSSVSYLKSLNHAYLVRVLDNFESSDYLYVCFEHQGGCTLTQYMNHHFKLGMQPLESQIRDWMKMLAQVLEYLHAHGIIVRNLEPDSIMFDNLRTDSVLKLFDLERATFLTPESRTMGQFGNNWFCKAPEVRKGATYTFKADSYSLGIIMYYMVFQEYPDEPLD